MKNRSLLIGCFVFPVIAIIAFYLGFAKYSSLHPDTNQAKKDIWLQINLKGDIPEYQEVEAGLSGSSSSVEEICRKINHAATDDNVKGLVLKPGFCALSMAGINEIGVALANFRASRKPVYAHLSMNNQKDYLIATYADKISMEPAQSAGLFLNGVSANLTFYKNLLDKLGLKVNVIRSGQFKSYGETYSQTAMSEEAYQNIQALLGQRYSQTISDLAKRRNLPADSVRSVFETRPDYIVTSDYAIKSGLIDSQLGYDEFLQQHKIMKKQLLALGDYTVAAHTGTGNLIAVIYLQGSIVSTTQGQMGYSITADKVQQQIDLIGKDKKIKAVVLRIDSPGGSALESEIIYRKLQALHRDLPIVVSMAGVAASGGYYISAASDYIVADPYTVTGSIGVIQLMPDASGLAKKIGITEQTIGFGKYAGAMNLWNSPDAQFLASLQRNSTRVYQEFKARVATGRKLPADSLDSIAEGRVWSAKAAKANGLVDEIGTLQSAVKKAASLAKITQYQTTVLPKTKPYLTALMEQINDRFQLKSPSYTIESMTAILIRQFQALARPYANLCLLTVEFD